MGFKPLLIAFYRSSVCLDGSVSFHSACVDWRKKAEKITHLLR